MTSPHVNHSPRPTASGEARAAARRAWLPALAFLAIFAAHPIVAHAAEPPAAIEGMSAGGRTSPSRDHADFAGTTASVDARTVADWIVQSSDNLGLSFIVVDKANAELFLFDPGGALRAAVPVLLGVGVGDDSPPGIGSQKLSTMKPTDQITPAGRFVAGSGRNLAGQDILWVDYEAAVSLHRATDRKPGRTAQSRKERLATPTTRDNRASHGCITVSVRFFDEFIRPTFAGTPGIVYILPETRPVREEFNIPA